MVGPDAAEVAPIHGEEHHGGGEGLVANVSQLLGSWHDVPFGNEENLRSAGEHSHLKDIRFPNKAQGWVSYGVKGKVSEKQGKENESHCGNTTCKGYMAFLSFPAA